MTKKNKKKAARGPDISDEAAALADTLKPTLAHRKAEFRSAHAAGMDALNRSDYAAVRDAIVRERKIIDVTGTSIQQARKHRK